MQSISILKLLVSEVNGSRTSTNQSSLGMASIFHYHHGILRPDAVNNAAAAAMKGLLISGLLIITGP